MTHVIVGSDHHAKSYQHYLEAIGDDVVVSMTAEGPFDLGFVCESSPESIADHGRYNVNTVIDLLAPRCKVLVAPKLDTLKAWTDKMTKHPSCQFVMAKPNLYRPQVSLLKDIRLLKNDICDIEICWDNIIGLIHAAHMVAGPLSIPNINGDIMTFTNFGIRTKCIEADYNAVRVNFTDRSVTTHNFTTDTELGNHGMIQDLFKLTKFNPSEFHKHFILDQFVHTLLE